LFLLGLESFHDQEKKKEELTLSIIEKRSKRTPITEKGARRESVYRRE